MLMSQEEQEKLNIKEAFDKQEKENIFEEPIPKNNFCYICHIKFEDYLLHLETATHKKNLNEENIYFTKTIKNVFKRVKNSGIIIMIIVICMMEILVNLIWLKVKI